ncbi:hypothetical protein EDB86DRAFT_3070888 [Lactarius hatsudake]|nr:hypothetical protein EDB86DRAFT_3070888 [Lactarius hatsudake]
MASHAFTINLDTFPPLSLDISFALAALASHRHGPPSPLVFALQDTPQHLVCRPRVPAPRVLFVSSPRLAASDGFVSRFARISPRSSPLVPLVPLVPALVRSHSHRLSPSRTLRTRPPLPSVSPAGSPPPTNSHGLGSVQRVESHIIKPHYFALTVMKVGS